MVINIFKIFIINHCLPRSAFRILVKTSCTPVTLELLSRKDVAVPLFFVVFTLVVTVFSSTCRELLDTSDLAVLFCFKLDETEI